MDTNKPTTLTSTHVITSHLKSKVSTLYECVHLSVTLITRSYTFTSGTKSQMLQVLVGFLAVQCKCGITGLGKTDLKKK